MMTLFTLMTVASLIVSGMGVSILGSVKVPLARRLEIDEVRVAGLIAIFGFVMTPVIFTAGFLTDTLGKQLVLIGGSLLMAASLTLLARARTYAAGLLGVVLASAGWAAMVNVNNTLIPLAFSGNLAYANNLANVFFGAGAFLMPIGVAGLLNRLSFTSSLCVLAGLVALPAALALGVDFSAAATSANVTSSSTGFGDLLRDPVLWLCGLAMFFYAPLEACTSGWATTYLAEKGVNEGTAARCLSAFWLTYIAARLVTAFALPAGHETTLTGHETTLICAMALLSIAVLAGIVVSRRPGSAAAMIIAAGFVFGPIFPTLMAVLLNHFDASLHGRAVGMLFAIGGLGWTVVPMLIGAYARRTSVQRGFSIAVGSAVGLTLIALALGWMP
jgi:hypothetical protein